MTPQYTQWTILTLLHVALRKIQLVLKGLSQDKYKQTFLSKTFTFFKPISLPCNIRIYHECECRIEKSVPRIAVWHHKACRVMTNGDPEGQILLSYPHTNNGFFFLPTTVFFIFFQNKLPDVPEYAKMQFHMMISL